MSDASRSAKRRGFSARRLGPSVALCVGLGVSLQLVLWLASGRTVPSKRPGAAAGADSAVSAPAAGPLLASAARRITAAPKEIVHDGPAGIRYVGEPERFVSPDGVIGHAYKLPTDYVPPVEVDQAAPPAEAAVAQPALGKQSLHAEIDGPALPEGARPVDFEAQGYDSLFDMEDAYRKHLKLGDHLAIQLYERTAPGGETTVGFQIFPRTLENIAPPEWMPPPALPDEEASGFVPPAPPER